MVDEEPQPLQHLRSHSHFARSGAVSTDAWPQILGNLLVHGLVLVPLFMLVITGARLVVALYATFNGLSQIADGVGAIDSRLTVPTLATGVIALGILVLVAVGALWLAFSSIARVLRQFRTTQTGSRLEPTGDRSTGPLTSRIVSSFLVASLLLSLCVQPIATWIFELVEKAWSGPNTGSLFSFRTVVEDALPDLTLLSWPNFLASTSWSLVAWWRGGHHGTRPSKGPLDGKSSSTHRWPRG